MEELIAKRYATALSSVVKDMPEVSEKLNILTKSIETKEVKNILLSPIISIEDKIDMILSALGKDEDKIFTNFIKVLGEKKRLDLIPDIAKVINIELQKESNQYEGILKSSNEINVKELIQLEKILERYTGSTIKLTHEKTDLNGLRVSVDDLGIEVNFSKQRVKEQLIDFIKKSL